MQETNVEPFYRMNRPQSGSSVEPQTASMRRANHGSSAWSLPSGNFSMNQPQDGAPERPARRLFLQAGQHVTLASEPEDARLTGGTRSLTRRVMGLNVIHEERKPSVSIMAMGLAAQVA